jgi:hypothetical protein
MDFRSKTFPANGLTSHPFLEHSSSTSVRVSAFVPFSSMPRSHPLNVLRGSTTGLEMVTYGLARATSHRVLSPPAGSTPRYSIPFFQNIGQNLRSSEIRLNCTYGPGRRAIKAHRHGSFQSHRKCSRSERSGGPSARRTVGVVCVVHRLG